MDLNFIGGNYSIEKQFFSITARMITIQYYHKALQQVISFNKSFSTSRRNSKNNELEVLCNAI